MSSKPTYHPAWWVPGPHLRTLWGRLVRRAHALPVRTERWTTPDDDVLELRRFAPSVPSGQASPAAATPRVVLFHGLEGGARSHYVANFFEEAARRGWAMDLVLFRGCNGEPNRAARFYHSGETEDAAFVVERLAREHPDAPLLLAGVSLGGNVLLKYLGESRREVPAAVKAAAAASVPFDLARGCRHISQGFSKVYERHFLESLKAKALEKLSRYPGLFDRARLERVATLWDFDDVVTAPVHGFRDAADYYARSSSIHYLGGIRTPTLLFSAEDDPFLPREVLDEVRATARANAALTVDFVKRGGHVGFVSGRVPWRPHWYMEWRMLEFFAQQLERIQVDRLTG